MEELTLGSLFDGIGGFPLAAQRCGIRPLWASEIEPNCISITKQHFPDMSHLGSITELDGGKIPPVDIISFGSPCQDLSVAGAQKGLSGERSGLFREAIRITYEMRAKTNGQYPTFIIWENVPGAFSSNNGGDFRSVLEEITKSKIPIPTSGKWATAGLVRAGGTEIAWRQLDAQYWRVPQRRKRIFLVGDFGGKRAAEILFKCESLLGYAEQGRTKKTDIAAAVENGSGKTSRNQRVRTTAGFSWFVSAGAGSTGYEEGKSPCIRATKPPAIIDAYISLFTGEAECVLETYPASDAVVHGGANGLGIGKNGDPAPTLTGRDRHGIAFFEEYRHSTYRETDTAGTSKASGGSCGPGSESLIVQIEQVKLFVKYILRKFTPLECERLQGYPDEWTRYGENGKEIKDTARYVAIGNSLAVPCAERVFRGIIDVMAERSG